MKKMKIKYDNVLNDLLCANSEVESLTHKIKSIQVKNNQLEEKVLSQNKYTGINNQMRIKYHKICKIIANSKHEINITKQVINFKPIFSLLDTFSVSINTIISKQQNINNDNLKHKSKVSELVLSKERNIKNNIRNSENTNHNSEKPKKKTTAHKNIPKKIKNTMMKRFIEIQKESESDPSISSLNSMRNRLNAIKTNVNHTSHHIIKTISTPNRPSSKCDIINNKKRDRQTRESESSSSDAEDYNNFIRRFSKPPTYNPPSIPNDNILLNEINRDAIYGYNTSELCEWINVHKNDNLLYILFKYKDNIKNKNIDGKKLLCLT
eukprot:389348_1